MPIRENIIDSRLTGREIRVKVMGYPEEIKGLIDEVAKYEIGIRSEKGAIVVYRHSILYAMLNAADLHGYSNERLRDTVIDSDMIGTEVELHLISGETIVGKLMKLSKYEMGLTRGDEGLIVPKSAISFATIKSEQTEET